MNIDPGPQPQSTLAPDGFLRSHLIEDHGCNPSALTGLDHRGMLFMHDGLTQRHRHRAGMLAPPGQSEQRFTVDGTEIEVRNCANLPPAARLIPTVYLATIAGPTGNPKVRGYGTTPAEAIVDLFHSRRLYLGEDVPPPEEDC